MNRKNKNKNLEEALKKILKKEKFFKKKLKKNKPCQFCQINGLKKWL